MWLSSINWQGRLLVIVLLLIAGIAFGYVVGVTSESNHRDALELKQKRDEDQAFSRALASGHQHAAEALAWQRRARTYYRNWQERLNHEKDTTLAHCQDAGGAQAQAGSVLFGGAFVGMYNAAWQPDDQGDTGGVASEVVATGAVTPRQVLENVAINAALCGDDRKRLDKLIDTLIDMGAGK